jgi:hyperosmotically inducible periplasmic protein
VRRTSGVRQACLPVMNKDPERMLAVQKANLVRSLLVSFALAISLAGCAAISGRETAGEYVDDATITTKIKASIINEIGMKEIGVETMQNTVQLSGFVDSQGVKDKAGSIARNTSGVKEVKNNIIVR